MKKYRPCYFELDHYAIDADKDPLSYMLPNAIQPLLRTISFGLPHGFETEQVRAILAQSATKVSITDVFPYTDKGQKWRSVTFGLRFENPKGDLSAEFINQTLQELIEAVRTQYKEVVHR